MAKDFVVAIELGSSRIRGIAGKKNADGSVNVLALVQEDSSKFIRKGYIYNIDKTTETIQRIVKQLSDQLGVKIKKVYVGMGGQSVMGVMNAIVREYDTLTKITQTTVDDVMDSNRMTVYPDKEILDVVVQEYKVDNQHQLDPVGIACKRFEGNFLNVTARNVFYDSIDKCSRAAHVPSTEIVLSPLALADAVLSEQEKRLGCVLVDLGAGTTTVSVYYKNILRHLVVIPIGGNNITKDIVAASPNMDENDAERLKLAHACADASNSGQDSEQTYAIDMDRSIGSRIFNNAVNARMTEIIENVKAQIPAEYEGKLTSGIILTGGGANLKNISEMLARMIRGYKIRIAKTVTMPVLTKTDSKDLNNATLNTVLGLMISGKDNCAGDEFDSDLFGRNGGSDTDPDEVHPMPPEPPVPPEPDQNGLFKKVGNFFKSLVEDEESSSKHNQ